MTRRVIGKVVEVESPWLSSTALQQYLGVGRAFVRDHIKASPRVSVHQLGGKTFFKKQDIDRLLESNTILRKTLH